MVTEKTLSQAKLLAGSSVIASELLAAQIEIELLVEALADLRRETGEVAKVPGPGAEE